MKKRTDDQTVFIIEWPSSDAVKLANAIYNTYIFEGKNPYLDLSVKRLCEMFNIEDNDASHHYIQNVFDELNEPAVVENFMYRGRKIEWQVITFCEFEHTWRDEDAYIEINLNELYIEAMKKLMTDPFLTFKKSA